MHGQTDEGHFYNTPSASQQGTWNSRLKPVILNCDLDLVSAWLRYECCTLSHWGKNMTKVLRKSFLGYWSYGADTKFKAQTHDLDLWPYQMFYSHIVLKFCNRCSKKWWRVLTLSWHGWLIGSAHRLTEANIWSLMKIFQRVHEMRSGQESVTEGQMDGQM